MIYFLHAIEVSREARFAAPVVILILRLVQRCPPLIALYKEILDTMELTLDTRFAQGSPLVILILRLAQENPLGILNLPHAPVSPALQGGVLPTFSFCTSETFRDIHYTSCHKEVLP